MLFGRLHIPLPDGVRRALYAQSGPGPVRLQIGGRTVAILVFAAPQRRVGHCGVAGVVPRGLRWLAG